MKRQGVIIYLLLILFSQTSCTKYFYSFVQSEQPDIKKNELGDFVQETDSVLIIYSFHGENLPVNITIANKIDKPMYVDWSQSGLVVEDLTPYFYNGQKEKKRDAFITVYTYERGEDFRNIREVYPGRYAEHLYSSEKSSFIPPDSRINREPFILSNFKFHKLPNEVFVKKPFLASDDREQMVNVMSFNENNSPVRFRSYVTLFTLEPNGKKNPFIVLEQQFYISTIIKAGNKRPENFRPYLEQRGDFFFVRDERSKNAGSVVGVIAIGVAGIALEVVAGSYEY